MISPTAFEDKKIKRFQERIQESNKKISEMKITMERILLRRDEFEQEINLINDEKKIKMMRVKHKNRRNDFHKSSLNKYNFFESLYYITQAAIGNS